MPKKANNSAGTPVDIFFQVMKKTEPEMLASAFREEGERGIEVQLGLVRTWLFRATDIVPNKDAATASLAQKIFHPKWWCRENLIHTLPLDQHINMVITVLKERLSLVIAKTMADLENDKMNISHSELKKKSLSA